MSNAIPEIVHILTPEQVTAIQLSAVGAAVCASMWYGMYLIITMRAIYVLIRRGLGGSRPRWMMLAVILMLFFTTTIVFTGDIQTAVEEVVLIGAPTFSAPSIQDFNFLYLIAGSLLIFMSDAVVVWRAWVICDRRWVKITLSCCVVGAIIANVIATVNKVRSLAPGGSPTPTFIAFLTVPLPLLITNVAATLAVGQAAWEYKRTVRENIRHSSTSAIVHRVLMLCVQSGLLYLILWTIHAVLFFIPSAIIQYYFVLMSEIYILGMWPSVIIILVIEETPLVETNALRHSFSVGHTQQTVVASGFDHRRSESKAIPLSPV
ncbi:hypothetical protein C8J56DRAFT_951157 [Mycena floridula]|nr:hypothetical protein C8J56DRAFT_951157 [Mycena floridula]